MARLPRQPTESPSKRLANLFKQMVRDGARTDRYGQPPKRPLREKLKERRAPARRAY